MTIQAIVHEESGSLWAEVPSMPGCVSEGGSMPELVANLWEAIEGWTDSRREFEPDAEIATPRKDRLEIVHAVDVAA